MELKKVKKSIQKMHNDKKGQSTNVLIGAVLGIVVVGILMYLGILISGEFRTNIDTTNLPAAFNTSIQNVDSNVTQGYDLASLGIFVLAAVAILGIVFGLVQFART